VWLDEERGGRQEAGTGAANLGADRPAGPGHQGPAAAQHGLDRLQVGVDLLAAQQGLDAQVADVAGADLAADGLVHAGQDLEGDLGLLAQGDDLAHQLAGGRGDGQQDDVDSERVDQPGDGRPGPPDGHPVEAPADLAPVVVDQADRVPAQRRAAQQVLEDHRAGRAGADDQHAAPLGGGGRSPGGEQLALEADGAGAEQGQDRPEDGHRQGQGTEAAAVGGQADEHAGVDARDPGPAAGQDDAAGLLGRGVAPHLAVEPAELVDHQVDGH